MSEHALPTNSAEWPKDPYRLLGVRPDVSARDLRRAYLQLIRRYKPEHAPKEFRLIREAYEVLERQVRFFQLHASEIKASEPQEDEEPATSSRAPREESGEDASSPQLASETVPTDASRTPRPREEDPWDLAIQGETERAYGQLVERRERFPARAEIYLQLYWLLVVQPRLDSSRTAWDWLIRGLLTTEGESGPLRELLRREIAAKPALAVGEDAARLLGPEMRPDFLLEFAELRWRTARHLLMWRIIRDDIDTLRDRSSAAWDEIYPRLLITAASQLIWDLDGAPNVVADLVHEAEQRSHFQKSIADELWRIDFGAELVKGWRASRRNHGLGALLHRLIPLTWEAPRSELSDQLPPFLEEVADQPQAALAFFDRLRAKSSVVIGHLIDVLNCLGNTHSWDDDARSYGDLSRPICVFFGTSAWWDYSSCRSRLLDFCLREAIAPNDLADFLDITDEFPFDVAQKLARLIRDDWPLRLVYLACDLATAPPAS